MRMHARTEVEYEVDLEGLKHDFAQEWSELVEAYDGDEKGAVAEFVHECWYAFSLRPGDHNVFFKVTKNAWDDIEIY